MTATQYANSQFAMSYSISRLCKFGRIRCAAHAAGKWFGAYRYGKSLGL